MQAENVTRLRIRLGELNMLSNGEPLGHADKELLDVVLHPKFDNLTKENDIALLRVSNKGLEFQVYQISSWFFSLNHPITFTAKHTSNLFARDGKQICRREWLGDGMGQSSEGEEANV